MDTEKIIKLLKKGDRSAQLELIDAYQDYVYTIARRMLKSDAIIEEAVQDVFIKVFRNFRQYKGEAKLSTWIYTITYRTCLNVLAAGKWKQIIINTEERNDEHIVEKIDRAATADSSAEWDVKDILWDAIDRLNQLQGVIITLFYLQSFSIAEIAGMMEIAENTVKTHLFRGRKRLKEILLQVYEIEDLL